ncbi:hypothetical protein KUTeg_013773 [Tegillarca granosa]|uniref:Uncharacterized protein n=1 Tax=Tegillarca granosa TaxID=220873 RepID=A0ABQ9EUP3_TEGGR|nr:hypothetical protein KUTeg_013773 [Tegillarca granosa]
MTQLHSGHHLNFELGTYCPSETCSRYDRYIFLNDKIIDLYYQTAIDNTSSLKIHKLNPSFTS